VKRGRVLDRREVKEMRGAAVCLSVLLCFFISGMLVHATDTPKEDSDALFERKCSVCHKIDRPKSQRKTQEEWKNTVIRMKNIHRAPITDEETKVIVDYLSSAYPRYMRVPYTGG
jgi:hypothetical protein